jgi:hypothetical protein
MPPQSTLSALISHTLPHLSADEVQDKEEFERYVLDSTLGQRAGGSGRAREDDWRSVVDEASRTGEWLHFAALLTSYSSEAAAIRPMLFELEALPFDTLQVFKL